MRRLRGGSAIFPAFAVAALLGTSSPGAGAPPAPPAATLATPVLSARRDPSWLDTTLARQRVAASLDAVTTAVHLAAPGGPSGCVLAEQGGTELFARDPVTELMPASNLKILTATAVLDTLGAADHLTTAVVAPARPVGGTVTGNLYLVGGGDPYLMTASYDSGFFYPEPDYTSLDHLASAVRSAGVTAVTGSVVGDGSRYDALTGVPTWPPIYLAEGDVGPLGALEVNDGSPPPAPPAPPPPPGTPAPPANRVQPGPADPALSGAQIFEALLKAHGVRVAGAAARGRAPAAGVTVATALSPPLGTEVEQMLRVSDDTAAELLTKELGYRTAGEGTTGAGVAVIRRAIAADGLPVAQMVADDGSGLDRGDRATCTLLVAALARAGTSGVLAAGLPVAGKSGTLTHRMVGTPAAGRLHAKTGTLIDVSALSGFVLPAAGAPTSGLAQPVYFSVILNGMDSDLAAPLVDRIASALAGYPDAVPLRVLGPRR